MLIIFLHFSPFTEGISDLAEHFKADEEIKDAYTTFSEHLEEINSFYSVWYMYFQYFLHAASEFRIMFGVMLYVTYDVGKRGI